MTARVVLSSAPDLDTAKSLGRALVEEGLVACATCLPGGVSVYRWEGKIEEASEVVLLLKTTEERVQAAIARLVELHPYDVPEAIALPVTAGSEAYLRWLGLAGAS